MQKRRFLTFLAMLMVMLLSLFLLSCAGSDGDDEKDIVTENSDLEPLRELLAMDPADMSEKDLDQVRLQTGGMSQEAYEEKYGPIDDDDTEERNAQEHPLLDAISSIIWGAWDKVDIPGAVCGNNTQYKIFMMKSTGFWNWLFGYTNDLIVYLEPGGACWDYPSCTGQTGIRGAANPDGIPDNFMNLGDYLDPNMEGGSVNAVISPLILRNHPTGDNVQTSRWNKVFIPYCTGDVHSGNRVATYVGDNGETIEYHHVGATNIEKVIDFLKQEFPNIDKLMITGSSAGGVGALTNYHFFREELDPSKCYLLDDSGPIFSATSDDDNQYRLHQKISTEWNTDYLVGKLQNDFPSVDITGDFGQIHGLLADAYPNDPLGITMFKRDTNFSGYSYARFYDLDESDPDDVEQILAMWNEDINNLMATYDGYNNLSYFIPYFRNMNESHCTAIVEFTGTEIDDSGIDVGNYINDILNGNPVVSYEEMENPSDADVTDFWMELVNLLL